MRPIDGARRSGILIGVSGALLARAAGFFERACSAGLSQACHDLAHLYDGGIGVLADAARARQLYQKACQAGYEASCQWLKQLGPAR